MTDQDDTNTRFDLELSIDGITQAEVAAVHERLSNIARGFALDGVECVEVTVWRRTEDDDGGVTLNPVRVGDEVNL